MLRGKTFWFSPQRARKSQRKDSINLKNKKTLPGPLNAFSVDLTGLGLSELNERAREQRSEIGGQRAGGAEKKLYAGIYLVYFHSILYIFMFQLTT